MTREVNVDEEAAFEDDRGGFDQGPKKKIPGMKAFVFIMLFLGLAIMGWIVWQNLPSNTPANQDSGLHDDDQNMMQNSLPRYSFATTPSNATFQAEKPEPEPEPEPKKPEVQKVPKQQTASVGPKPDPEPTPEEKALQRRLAAFSNGGSGDNASAYNAAAQGAPKKQSGGGNGGLLGGGSQGSKASGDLAQRLDASQHSSVSARTLAHPSFTVPMGTMILCGTTTELDSTQPGMVGCQVSRDVYSANGKVRLIDKGTHVVGEVATAMKHGQDRVFVLWTRMRTPDNVIINLNSPGTNRLGSAGIPGQVDTHFWERFGGALLVSVMADAGEAAIQAAANSANSGDNNTNISLGNTQQTSNEMAREILRATIDIPPTLYAHQGKSVAIYVARDLDLSSVYSLSYDN